MGCAGQKELNGRNEPSEGYLRLPIPPAILEDAQGRSLSVQDLAPHKAVLLLFLNGNLSASDRDIVAPVPDWVRRLRLVRIRIVLPQTGPGSDWLNGVPSESRAVPVVERRLLADPGGRARQSFGVAPTPMAVLLGTDGLLAGGPVHGKDEIRDFVESIVEQLDDVTLGDIVRDHSDSKKPGECSVDVLIPLMGRDELRLRNLFFTIEYYNKHLPQARILLIEQNGKLALPKHLRVYRHERVDVAEELFCKSLLFNEGFKVSTASHLILADGDCLPEVELLQGFDNLVPLLKGTYLVAHEQVHFLPAEATEAFIAGRRANTGQYEDIGVEFAASTVGGVTIVSAENYHRVGGFDQAQFVGWGGEDDELYNRFLMSELSAFRLPGGLIHLFHTHTEQGGTPRDVVHAKGKKLGAARLPSPRSRTQPLRDLLELHRVGLVTNSLDPALLSLWRSFSSEYFPEPVVIDGIGGRYGRQVFDTLLTDPGLRADFDYLIYSDEDNFIVDWQELKATLEVFIEGGYGFAGMPDGGVISHRFHNPVAVNPFLSFVNLRQFREIYDPDAVARTTMTPGLQRHWASDLRVHWDGEVEYPRIQRVLDEGFTPFGVEFDMFEPYYPIWFHALESGLTPLYLDARDAPHIDGDGCCTEVLGVNGNTMSFHSWFGRDYGRDPEQTARIERVAEKALAFLRY